jgi:hypothetical protein
MEIYFFNYRKAFVFQTFLNNTWKFVERNNFKMYVNFDLSVYIAVVLFMKIRCYEVNSFLFNWDLQLSKCVVHIFDPNISIRDIIPLRRVYRVLQIVSHKKEKSFHWESICAKHTGETWFIIHNETSNIKHNKLNMQCVFIKLYAMYSLRVCFSPAFKFNKCKTMEIDKIVHTQRDP